MPKLTIKRVERLTTKGKYADGGGLYLQVHSATNRSWLFRYKMNGRTHWMGLGSLNTYDLEEVREEARRLRQQKRDGLCPIRERHKAVVANKLAAAKDKTFKECATAYFDLHKGKWQDKWQKDFTRQMNEIVYPAMGDTPVSMITTDQVFGCVEPVWIATPNTGAQVRRRIKDILDYATAHGYRTGENPASWEGNLKHRLPAVEDLIQTKHHEALPFGDAPAFIAKLRNIDSVVARALEFTILTASRTGETIAAKWDEIDFATKTWSVPKERMKMGIAHRVPLTPRCIELLQALPRVNDYVFPSAKHSAGHISEKAMARQLRAMDGKATVHGFRSCFKDWASETTSFPNEVSEMALAHKIGTAVEQAYRRGDLFIKRTKLMETWSDFLGRPVAPVAELRRAS